MVCRHGVVESVRRGRGEVARAGRIAAYARRGIANEVLSGSPAPARLAGEIEVVVSTVSFDAGESSTMRAGAGPAAALVAAGEILLDGSNGQRREGDRFPLPSEVATAWQNPGPLTASVVVQVKPNDSFASTPLPTNNAIGETVASFTISPAPNGHFRLAIQDLALDPGMNTRPTTFIEIAAIVLLDGTVDVALHPGPVRIWRSPVRRRT